MRLSEAILLGRVLLKPYPGKVFREGGRGCAIGMALAAVGERPDENMPTMRPWEVFPILGQQSPLPCRHSWDEIHRDLHDVFNVIAHIFDYHIHNSFTEENDWTTERLADYVRSIEPAEPEEESDGPDPYDMAVETEMELEARNGRSDERD